LRAETDDLVMVLLSVAEKEAIAGSSRVTSPVWGSTLRTDE
jgi:hypothetical protein